MQANYRRHSAEQIAAALRHAATVDRMIKGLLKGDVWDELLQLGLRFSKGNMGSVSRPRRLVRNVVPAGQESLY
jgi:hypothetical protein